MTWITPLLVARIGQNDAGHAAALSIGDANGVDAEGLALHGAGWGVDGTSALEHTARHHVVGRHRREQRGVTSSASLRCRARPARYGKRGIRRREHGEGPGL